jgi:hypothetical protein
MKIIKNPLFGSGPKNQVSSKGPLLKSNYKNTLMAERAGWFDDREKAL